MMDLLMPKEIMLAQPPTQFATLGIARTRPESDNTMPSAHATNNVAETVLELVTSIPRER